MMSQFIFSEVSPSAQGTSVSSQPVQNSSLRGVAYPLDDFESLLVTAELVGATGGTLDVSIQSSLDQGVNWYEVIHFAQLAAGAPAVVYSAPLSLATNTNAPVLVGKNTASVLTAGKVVNGAFGDRLRLLMTAGSGTSLGAPVVVRITGQRARVREYGR